MGGENQRVNIDLLSPSRPDCFLWHPPELTWCSFDYIDVLFEGFHFLCFDFGPGVIRVPKPLARSSSCERDQGSALLLSYRDWPLVETLVCPWHSFALVCHLSPVIFLFLLAKSRFLMLCGVLLSRGFRTVPGFLAMLSGNKLMLLIIGPLSLDCNVYNLCLCCSFSLVCCDITLGLCMCVCV